MSRKHSHHISDYIIFYIKHQNSYSFKKDIRLPYTQTHTYHADLVQSFLSNTRSAPALYIIPHYTWSSWSALLHNIYTSDVARRCHQA